MFPFVFLTLMLSLPFTLQIVAFFRQEQLEASSHKGNQGGWGKRMVETNSFNYQSPSILRLQVLHPPAPGKLHHSVLNGQSGPHTLPLQLTSFCPVPLWVKRVCDHPQGLNGGPRSWGMQQGCCCSTRMGGIAAKPLPCSQSPAWWLFPPAPSAQTSHVVSSHATNTSKTSSPASVMEAIKISDSTDNRQGHQLKGTLLSDNQGFIDLKKKKVLSIF